MAKRTAPADLAGQLMMQISAGRFFRPEAHLNETLHRRVIHTNVWFPNADAIELPVGRYIPSTGHSAVGNGVLEALDRLEAQREDGSDDWLIATGGDHLIDDLAYVMTFTLNRTFSRDHDLVHRLVATEPSPVHRRGGRSLFPHLFEPAQVLQPTEVEQLTSFMSTLIALRREDFARAMRVIRTSVDATRRAVEDPTGAYTDLVAALESLSEPGAATTTTWDRLHPRTQHLLDDALREADAEVARRVRTAVLEVERAGLKRRFVCFTLAHIAPGYYREEAVGAASPPRAIELENALGVAYDIRSRKSHVLQDLGEEAWVFTDGAETAFERSHRHVLTLAGLWRLTRHVVRQYVITSTPEAPAPWDYRQALPGIVHVQLAPQYWVGQVDGLSETTAETVLDGVISALIEFLAQRTEDGVDLRAVATKIEALVPKMPPSDARTAMVAIYLLWHQWGGPAARRPEADAFIQAHVEDLDIPSPAAFAVSVLTNHRPQPWSVQQWVELASARHQARARGGEQPLPAALDALIQLQAADELEQAGRHEEAVRFAAAAVQEVPGHEGLIAWERALIAGAHDPHFSIQQFLFGRLLGPAADSPPAVD